MGSVVSLPSLLPEDEQREKSISHQTVQQLVLEKEQALADLNSVEKSLADLFRRYEKMKEVLEGFRKVCVWSPSAGGGGRGCSGPGGEGRVPITGQEFRKSVLSRREELGSQLFLPGVLLSPLSASSFDPAMAE